VNPIALAFLLGSAFTLLVIGGALFVVDLNTTAPLAEPTRLARVATTVAASAALPVAVLLVGVA